MYRIIVTGIIAADDRSVVNKMNVKFGKIVRNEIPRCDDGFSKVFVRR